MCKQESLGRSAPFEPDPQLNGSHESLASSDAVYFLELADRPWDLQVKPQNVFGHGLTGRFDWAIIYRNGSRPRIRYGVSATKERALKDMGYALGELVSNPGSENHHEL